MAASMADDRTPSRPVKPWVLYVRVSTDDQADAGVSLDMQRESCRSYAKARGWAVIAEEVDDGYSGATLKRPGIERALAKLRDGSAAGIIVWKFDRLTRWLRDLLAIVDLCDERGAALVSVTEAVDTSTPSGRLMLNIIGSFAQHERETISARVAAAMAHVKKQGYWTGGHVPPGCEVVQDGERRRLVRGPHADTVAQVWTWVLAGDGLISIAKRLREAGVPAPGHVGKPAARGWTPPHVWNLVRSVQVTGLLVDAATQAAAVQVLAKKATPTRRGPDRKPGARAAEPAMLAGLAKCPRCGSSLVLTTPRGNGGVYRYLRCSLANKNRGLCPHKDARAEPIEKAALVAIGDLVGRQDYRRAILGDREEALAQAQAAREERASLTAQRDQLAARIGHLARTMRVGTVEFTESMRALGKDVEAIDRRLAELAGILAVAEVDNGNLEQVLQLMEAAATLLPHANPGEAARTVRAWVQRIEVHDDKVVVDFYAPEKVRTPGYLPGVRTQVAIGTPSRTACEPGRVYRLVAPRAPAAGRAPLALR